MVQNTVVFHHQGATYTTKKGGFSGIMGIGRDVTSSVKKAEALRESKAGSRESRPVEIHLFG
jgi:hypothetical protein